jgi:hypothetical protein
MGEKRGVYGVLVGKREGKRPLGSTMHRWEDNIKMDLQKVGWGALTGLICFKIGTGGRHLQMRQRTFGFHKMWGIS